MILSTLGVHDFLDVTDSWKQNLFLMYLHKDKKINTHWHEVI